MKRHSMLVKISREHHLPLNIANHVLNHPEEDGTIRILEHKKYLLDHFDEEEAMFKDLWDKLPDDVREPYKNQFFEEHKYLREEIDKLDSREKIEEYVKVLQKHVRFEERELFNALQEHCLPPDEE